MLRERGLERFNNAKFIAKCFYFIDRLYLRRVIQNKERTSYLPFNSANLRRVVNPRSAKDVKNVLIALHVIESLKHDGRETYTPGLISKCYRFTEAYSGKFHAVPVPDFQLLRRIRALQARLSVKEIANHPGKDLIYRSVLNVDFNLDGAKRFIEGTSFPNQHSRNWHNYCVEIMGSKDLGNSRLTSRAAFTIHFLICPANCGSSPVSKGRGFFRWTCRARTPAWPLRSTEAIPGKGMNISLFLVGGLIGHLNACAGHSCDISDGAERSQFKEQVFRRVFYSPNRFAEHPLWNAFNDEFPELAGEIWKAKENHQRDLAIFLQRMEAAIVIDGIASKFAERHRGQDICLISIHDCFLTTAEFVMEVQEMLREGYEEVIGFRPIVKIKPISEAPRLRIPDPIFSFSSPK